MNVVQWHPEELIDKRLEGTLSALEREELETHLSRCSACRFELAVGGDLDEEDHEADDEDVTDLVLAVVRRREAQDEPTASSHPRRRLGVAVFAVAALTSLSAAAVLRATSNERAIQLAPPPMHQLAPTLPSTASDTTSSESGQDDQAGEPAGDEAQDRHAPASSARVASAEALFAQANAARRRGDRAEAIRLYQQLQRRHPDSPEAKLSHATLGKLLLDNEDPAKALKSFDDYLENQRGSVSEEALVGRAQALERLGRKDQERAAWQQLLQRYPQSIHAARARARLAELTRAE